MAILVDSLFETGRQWLPHTTQACHLATDEHGQAGLSKLIDFAKKIGMKSSWLQWSRAGNVPHFDLSPARRALALANGAQETGRREILLRCRWTAEEIEQAAHEDYLGNF